MSDCSWCIDSSLTGCMQVIPFVAGGFMYIGAVAVLPTYVYTGRAFLESGTD